MFNFFKYWDRVNLYAELSKFLPGTFFSPKLTSATSPLQVTAESNLCHWESRGHAGVRGRALEKCGLSPTRQGSQLQASH